SVIGWRLFSKAHPPPPTDHPNLNQRSAQYVGRKVRVCEAITLGRGKVRVDDSPWIACAKEDIAVDMMVEVVAVEGAELHVVACR
ncbi:NfeD family protein, partial [Magnetococcales bacterium HHB-1]